MAKQVKLAPGKEFTFSSTKGGGKASKYPWAQWFDGTLWMLEFATDMPRVESKFIPGKIKAAARRAYKIVQISNKDADGNKLDDAVIVKARDMTPDERAAEDAQRNKEKLAQRARIAAAKAQKAADAVATSTPPPTPEEAAAQEAAELSEDERVEAELLAEAERDAQERAAAAERLRLEQEANGNGQASGKKSKRRQPA